MKVLSSESMKPSKLKRHLETKHVDCKNKDLSFFMRNANRAKRSRIDTSGAFQQQYRAAVEATFVVTLRIAKAKKPHTIAEQLILPCAKDVNRILIGKKAESKLNVLSLSDNTVQRRIFMMFEDIKNQVIDQMKSAGLFALQLDESTDVSVTEPNSYRNNLLFYSCPREALGPSPLRSPKSTQNKLCSCILV